MYIKTNSLRSTSVRITEDLSRRRYSYARRTYVQTRIIGRTHNYTRRTRESARPHPKEGCLRSRASKRSLISWHLRLTILRLTVSEPEYEAGLFALSSSTRSLVTFVSPRKLYHRRGSPFLSFLVSSVSPVYRWHMARPHKDVPGTYVDYYGPSCFYSPSGWRTYHRHLVSRD